jgi:hypothetical protein
MDVPKPPSPEKAAQLGGQLTLALSAAKTSVAAGFFSTHGLWLSLVGALLLAGSVVAILRGAQEKIEPVEQAALRTVGSTDMAAPVQSSTRPHLVSSADASAAIPIEELQAAESLSSAKLKVLPRDLLAEEESIIEQARRVASTSPQKALSLLLQHQRRFPNGQLVAERLYLTVDVLTRLGDNAGARQKAALIERNYPKSVYAAKLRARSLIVHKR